MNVEQMNLVLSRSVEQGDVAGVVASVVSRDEVLYEGAFGERTFGEGAAMSPDSVMMIASMTKPLVATAAMQLVEQGRLDLDAPLSRMIPQICSVQVLEGWDAEGQPMLRPPSREITLRHLMTHTAGFGGGMWNADVARYNKAAQIPSVVTGDPRALQSVLVFDPGTRWHYGLSIDWVARIVEVVTGQGIGAFMQDHIFDPLGMSSTAYRISSDMRSRLANVHQRKTDGGLAPIDTGLQQEPVIEMGGGGLYSTAVDYMRFVRMILNDGTLNGHRILKAETVALMATNAMGPIRVEKLGSGNPALSADLDLFPDTPKSWGLSFMINEEIAPTGRAAGSLAWAGLANTYFWIDRQSGIGGVFLTQVYPFLDPRVLQAYLAFETAAYRHGD